MVHSVHVQTPAKPGKTADNKETGKTKQRKEIRDLIVHRTLLLFPIFLEESERQLASQCCLRRTVTSHCLKYSWNERSYHHASMSVAPIHWRHKQYLKAYEDTHGQMLKEDHVILRTKMEADNIKCFAPSLFCVHKQKYCC